MNNVIQINSANDVGIKVEYKSGNELIVNSKINAVSLGMDAYVTFFFKDSTYTGGVVMLEKELLRKVVKALDLEESLL